MNDFPLTGHRDSLCWSISSGGRRSLRSQPEGRDGLSDSVHRGLVAWHHYPGRAKVLGSPGHSQLHSLGPAGQGIPGHWHPGAAAGSTGADELALLSAAEGTRSDARAAASGLLGVQCQHQPGHLSVHHEWCGKTPIPTPSCDHLASAPRRLLALSKQGRPGRADPDVVLDLPHPQEPQLPRRVVSAARLVALAALRGTVGYGHPHGPRRVGPCLFEVPACKIALKQHSRAFRDGSY